MSLSMRGSNLTGGDTLWSDWDLSSGPISGTHYLFVDPALVDRLVAKGMNTFRVVFGWEALQPKPMGPIPGPGNFGEYFRRLKALVDYITLVKRRRVVLDVHGGSDTTFARYFGKLVGSEVPTSVFTNLWAQLAIVFRGNSRVLIGVTNEPTNMPTMQWFGVAQSVIDAVRNTGSRAGICMPGNYFSGAGSWTSTSGYDTGSQKRSNGYGWDNARGPGLPLRDPLKRLAVQVHLYLDPDAGGGSEEIASANIGVDRLRVVVDWARPRGLAVLVGEVGLSAKSPLAVAAWNNLVSYMVANRDVVLGFCWWSVGDPSWWGGYKFSLIDGQGRDTAQMKIIEASLRP